MFSVSDARFLENIFWIGLLLILAVIGAAVGAALSGIVLLFGGGWIWPPVYVLAIVVPGVCWIYATNQDPR